MSLKKKISRRINKHLSRRQRHGAETVKVRHLFIEYCQGFGCDVGFGGDKIKKTDCAGIDFARPYAYAGEDKVDIACDLSKESIPVADSSFDYVYSSHLIEDFADTNRILKDFIRIVKSGGNLVLVFPDQTAYEIECKRTGQPINIHHVHADMGFDFMMRRLTEVAAITGTRYELLFKSDREIDYNVVIVLRILK